MKLNNQPYRTVALLLLVMLAAACTKEDDFAAPPDEGTANAAPLTITVTDGAYAPAETPDNGNTPDTRAVERDYGTEFTKGDQIGLYVVKKEDASKPDGNRSFLQQNLCLTHDGTGWTLPAGTELTHQPPTGGEVLYFAYYPYQDKMEGKVNINALDDGGIPTTEARPFFRWLIDEWTPADDQSTYEAYTASDLMVARGEVAKRTDGTDGSALSFKMEHQMALAVIRVPTTVYTYDETIDGVTTEKSYRLYCGITIKGWMADDNTYRYLVKPKKNSQQKVQGSYYNASLEKRNFEGKTSPNESGKYFLYTVDKGEEAETKRTLQEGDFYMRDGSIIPQENVPNNMPNDVRKDCLGVVFWVGEKEQDTQTAHWTKTGNRKGDYLLMRDHPGCVHGLVVALHDASLDQKIWSSSTDNLREWANSYPAFTAEEKKDLDDINESNVYFGYSRTRLLELYKAGTSARTDAYDAILDYAGRYPAPYSCSGWYFPSVNELLCIWRITPDATSGVLRINQLNKMLIKAGGDKLKEDYYWTSCDVGGQAYSADLVSTGSTRYAPKQNSYYVRAVLAF